MMPQLTTMTLELPTELLRETEQLINAGKAQGINDLVIQALKRELVRLKQSEIDTELTEITNDPDYQQKMLKLDGEFALASWEALEEDDKPLKGKVISYEKPFESAVNEEDWDVLQ
jgi:hypothetical protein